jgi:hypothetical protein
MRIGITKTLNLRANSKDKLTYSAFLSQSQSEFQYALILLALFLLR